MRLNEAVRTAYAQYLAFHGAEQLLAAVRERIFVFVTRSAPFLSFVLFLRAFEAAFADLVHLFREVFAVFRVFFRFGTLPAQHRAPGSRHRPLRCGSTLIPKLQRIAVLPLRGSEVAGCGASHRLYRSAVYQRGGEQHPLAECRTSVVQSRERHLKVTHGEAGRADLVEQIAGEHEVYAVKVQPCEANRTSYRLSVHFAFRLFVGFFTPEVVAEHGIEAFSEIAVPLLRPHDRIRRAQIHRLFCQETLSAFFHSPTSAPRVIRKAKSRLRLSPPLRRTRL